MKLIVVHRVVLFCLVVPVVLLRDVDPSSGHMYIMGYSFIKDISSVKGGNMAHIQLIYGDEPQLIEERKRIRILCLSRRKTVLGGEGGLHKNKAETM